VPAYPTLNDGFATGGELAPSIRRTSGMGEGHRELSGPAVGIKVSAVGTIERGALAGCFSGRWRDRGRSGSPSSSRRHRTAATPSTRQSKAPKLHSKGNAAYGTPCPRWRRLPSLFAKDNLQEMDRKKSAEELPCALQIPESSAYLADLVIPRADLGETAFIRRLRGPRVLEERAQPD